MSFRRGFALLVGGGIVALACWLFVQQYHPAYFPWTGIASLVMMFAAGVAIWGAVYYWGRLAIRRTRAKA